MERIEIITKLSEIFEDIIDDGPVLLSDIRSASDVPGWDSLINIQIIVAIENCFNIKFTAEEITSWRNVGDLVNIILTK